jgi:peptidoglycan hydrolase-like protein with peptidoglycan-binding domain
MSNVSPPVPQAMASLMDNNGDLGLVLIRPGDSGNAVKTIQARLHTLGFFQGLTDGVYGSVTTRAVAAFQRANNFPATGAVDHFTLQALGYDVDESAPPAPSQSGGVLSVPAVAKLFPDVPLANIQNYLPVVLRCLSQLALGDLKMVLMAIATIRVETGSFAPISEYQSEYNTAPGGAPFGLYDSRADLGNTQPGDGARFKGRGFVQLTGRNNYARYSQEAGLGDELLQTPDAANDPLIAARILAAYLKDHEAEIRSALSHGDLAAARKAVNGGTHGLAQFQLAFQKGASLAGLA